VVGYTIVLIGVILLIFCGLSFGNWMQRTNVLGISTFLAQDGRESGEESGISGSGDEHEEVTPTQTNTNTTEKSGNAAANEEHSQTGAGVTIVTCIAPDKKSFKTSAFNCEYLNRMWRNSRSTSESGKQRPPRPTGGIGTEKHTIIIRPHKPENELENENDLQVEQNGEDDFVIKQGSVGARSKFPLSLNPDTRQLTVTTPNGTKNVAVLPESAVQNLVDKKIITNLDDSSPDASSSVSLEVKNKNPVFVITGDSKQHFLGFIPVTIHKSIDVSAQTGDIVGQDESFAQRLLDIFSF